MSSKRKTNGNTETETTPTEAGKRTGSAEGSGREQEIRIRAYEFYLERGGEPGHELDDWLEAERELASRLAP
jgi:Protein of unknown function (DUF2934)